MIIRGVFPFVVAGVLLSVVTGCRTTRDDSDSTVASAGVDVVPENLVGGLMRGDRLPAFFKLESRTGAVVRCNHEQTCLVFVPRIGVTALDDADIATIRDSAILWERTPEDRHLVAPFASDPTSPWRAEIGCVGEARMIEGPAKMPYPDYSILGDCSIRLSAVESQQPK